MSEHIFKSHNKTVLLYHLEFLAKYRRKLFTKGIENTLIDICKNISQRYEINFLEIGNNEDHVHFIIQGILKMPVSRIVQIVKSITARELFALHPEIKKVLRDGNLWTSGFYANTVGQFASEDTIKNYVKNHNKSHCGQLKLDL